jgi:hypothetical protein
VAVEKDARSKMLAVDRTIGQKAVPFSVSAWVNKNKPML